MHFQSLINITYKLPDLGSQVASPGLLGADSAIAECRLGPALLNTTASRSALLRAWIRTGWHWHPYPSLLHRTPSGMWDPFPLPSCCPPRRLHKPRLASMRPMTKTNKWNTTTGQNHCSRSRVPLSAIAVVSAVVHQHALYVCEIAGILSTRV